MLQKINDQIRLFPAIYSQVPNKQAGWNCPTLRSLIQHSSPRRLAGEKKATAIIIKQQFGFPIRTT